MPITMTELARRLNLSHSTVSLVLNNRYRNRVRPEVADLILSTARELGYHPNRAASELRRQQSSNIGVLLPSPRNFYYGEIVADLHREIRRRNYSPVFSFWDEDKEQQDALEAILSWHSAGIITVEPQLLPENVNVPVVSFYNSDPRFDLVELDLDSAVNQVLDYLHELGHREIAWLGNPDDRRYELYLRHLPEYGMELPERCRAFGRGILSFADGSAMFDRLLEQCAGKLPTAIVAHNDMVAIGIIRRAAELGYRIPADFSIVGQDDIVQDQFTLPTLTSIHYAGDGSVGSKLVETIFQRIDDPDSERRIIRIAPTLVKRESCGTSRRTSVPANNETADVRR